MIQLASPELTGVKWQHGGLVALNSNDNAIQRP